MPSKTDLSAYRVQEAKHKLEAAESLLSGNFYKDSINRSYYSVLNSIKAVLALDETDFKKHKSVLAYFNKEYVNKGVFEKDLGRRI